ncbi:unnamed protein product, partial [Mesorhabditis spiculigera]
MPALSKMAPAGMTMARYGPLGLLQPKSQVLPLLRFSHAHLFRKRPAQLIVNRIKDVVHFYLVGIGLFPVFAFLTYNHIYHGTCELKDYPTEGPPPAYWQFERTPARQWWAKHFGLSDMEHHERNMAYHEKIGIIGRWRQLEQRVKHLEGQRWDYKAWHYQPVSSTWIDLGRYNALQLRDRYEAHGHYTY